ncbi:MAG TPA: hypothetical protein VN455_11525, partial [Methanotrichaceae archaeon]|nr:hypothetical protein [Methanotrichaceae archaeon]
MNNIVKKFAVISLIFLISVSLTSGLKLTASTGDNGESSSTAVVYGATVEDYASEHIALSHKDRTLSNVFTGTGSLPSGSVSKSDIKGDEASVTRSITGEPETTWTYDWGTKTLPSSAGVEAWLTLDVSNARAIYGSGSASNGQGNTVRASIDIGSKTADATSVLSGYKVTSDAYPNIVAVEQKVNKAESPGLTAFMGSSDSKSGKDSSEFNLYVHNGKAEDIQIVEMGGSDVLPEISAASIQKAYGTSTKIESKASNKWTAADGKKKIDNGGAYFTAKKENNEAFSDVSVTSMATRSDLDMSATGFSKTALLLEPFNWDFGDLYGSAGSDLENKGYAVTDYKDSGVTWDKVYKLNKYTVSLISTHGVGDFDDKTDVCSASYGLCISRVTDQKYWPELKKVLTDPAGTNELMIFDACGSFFKNPSGDSGSDVTKNSKVSGGFAPSIGVATDFIFMKKFFNRLCEGDT